MTQRGALRRLAVASVVVAMTAELVPPAESVGVANQWAFVAVIGAATPATELVLLVDARGATGVGGMMASTNRWMN